MRIHLEARLLVLLSNKTCYISSHVRKYKRWGGSTKIKLKIGQKLIESHWNMESFVRAAGWLYPEGSNTQHVPQVPAHRLCNLYNEISQVKSGSEPLVHKKICTLQNESVFVLPLPSWMSVRDQHHGGDSTWPWSSTLNYQSDKTWKSNHN